MKKNYITPALISVNIEMTHSMLITQSTTSASTEDSGGELGTKGSNYNIWDDNED